MPKHNFTRIQLSIVFLTIVLVGASAGYLFYRHNLNNHFNAVSDEANTLLALSSSYVSVYSHVRNQSAQTPMPVPAAFRAQASDIFNENYQSNEHFMALMVGLPGRYIATAPTDSMMSQALSEGAFKQQQKYSRLIALSGEPVLRTMFPSIANQQSCVDCHNDIQNPSIPWRINDLMGAYVIDRGVKHTSNRYAFFGSVVGILVSSVLSALFIVGMLLRRLHRQAADLERLSDTDPLTHILNRRGFDKWSARLNPSLKQTSALLVLDIDHFKKINDTYGHIAGDQVLIWFVQTVCSVMRNRDVMARIGGEEFVVYLSDVTEVIAEVVADRICNHVASAPFSYNHADIHVTVSIGAVHMNRCPDQPISRFCNIADQFLYQAKKSGRNRVIWPAPLVSKSMTI
jgi:diguanylate cyclase (GGDEF)-like protein